MSIGEERQGRKMEEEETERLERERKERKQEELKRATATGKRKKDDKNKTK